MVTTGGKGEGMVGGLTGIGAVQNYLRAGGIGVNDEGGDLGGGCGERFVLVHGNSTAGCNIQAVYFHD